MRTTRTLITGAAFVAVSAAAGTASAQLQLKGSDTLELVTKDVIAACPGANGNITYIGGGSGVGQSAMTAATPTQHVAPMSRQLNGTGCTTTARQLLIGLDGIVVVAKNPTGGNPNTCTDDVGGGTAGAGGVPAALVLGGIPAQFVLCTSDAQCATAGGTTCDTVHQFCNIGGSIAGCTAAQGCSPDGTYTFDNGTASTADDWKDVLAQIYGGQNHTTAAQMQGDDTEVNADGTAICVGRTNCKRNPARIDCTNPVRGVLLASYQSIIRTPTCTTGSPECVKLKHAFRRDDLSGTTDAFQALVGLVAIAPFSTLRSTVGGANAPEIADTAAVTNPFCNGGTASLNKGFTDGLDLDPYRRACSTGPAPDRFGLESVCQAFSAPTNGDTGCYVTGGSPAVLSPTNYPQRDRSAPQGRGLLAGGSVDTLAALANDYTLTNATRPRCLGVVLPISIPTDVVGQTAWATDRYPAGGNCASGVRAFVNPLPARTMMCPDGSQKAAGGTCRMPQNTTNGRFDCIVDSPLPAGAGISDARVYNLGPVNSVGGMAGSAPLTDAYVNPNFSTANLRRFSRRFFGLHMVRPDSSQSPATTAGPCVATDDTSQIGCLVKASPCSIGYAGREAADAASPFQNVALRVEGVQATQATIENLATGGAPVYGMARKLWFNSVQGTLTGFAQPNLTDPELALSTCMGLPAICASDADCTAPVTCNLTTGRCNAGNTVTVDGAIFSHNFVVVPASVPRFTLNGSGAGCPL
jgi:hypothetical protein